MVLHVILTTVTYSNATLSDNRVMFPAYFLHVRYNKFMANIKLYIFFV